MQITITPAMVAAFTQLGHVPDELRARLDAMKPVAGGHVLTLSDDEAMALAELVQWHMRTDPATGKPTPETAPFGALIALIDEAQL